MSIPPSDVDHKFARCNEGINDLSNLQAICQLDHHQAKTKVDTPWTAGRDLREEEKIGEGRGAR